MTEIKFTNLMGVEVTVMTASKPAKIKCYLCGKDSENFGDFTYCGNQGFAHPGCLGNYRADVSIASGMQARFNPVEGRSAQDIILWFQSILEVELNLQNYTLAENAINLHLINNSTPSVKSVLDDLECIEPLKAFAFELKKNLLY